MNITITNVSMNYKDDVVERVRVNFQGRDEDRTININGYIPLTTEQYEGNESIASLTEIVREEVATKIMNNDTE